MAIIGCLFYASVSLSSDVSWAYIVKLLVVWLYLCFNLIFMKVSNQILSSRESFPNNY